MSALRQHETLAAIPMGERSLSFGEELANALTHGVGLLGSLIGLPVLLMAAVGRGNGWHIAGCTVFGASLIALYAISTVYHALPPSRAKGVFRIIDHIAIYLLIAGSYTPFTLGVLQGGWRWSLLGAVWGMAAVGILFKLLVGFGFPRVSTMSYLVMGWLAVIAARPLAAALPPPALLLLLAGGLSYTAGVAFFVWERPRYSHTVWHLCVLGGSVCHFFAVLWYAVPASI